MTPTELAAQVDTLAAQLKAALLQGDALDAASDTLTHLGNAAQYLGGSLRVIAAAALAEYKSTGIQEWDALAEECFDAATPMVTGGVHVEEHAIPAVGDVRLAVTR
ncbi:hypothetical protein AB0C10_37600 [Microbispora amethystogenes]|uniref:hypothetical protein n=1 Tax=Microbispora amethystogenes TaxID=1427754 RepID=UPI0033F58210